jgi:hypothetical protein
LTSVDVQTALQRPRKVAARMIPVFAVTWYLFARAVKILPKSSQKATEKQSKRPFSSQKDPSSKQSEIYRKAAEKIPWSSQKDTV